MYCKCSTTALALLCLLPVVTLAQKAGADQDPPAPLGKLIDVGGYRVHLYCTGTGSPAVVIVGAGFSFNWGLVQPEVAKFTQVCSYDHSGIGWSEAGPADSCSLRVNEVHTALKNAGIKGPYVMVGHSLGALVARIYAGRFPEETAGIVFVDHASDFRALMPQNPKSPRGEAPASAPSASPKPLPPVGGQVHGIEDDPNFSKLSARDRELHLWGMAQVRNQMALRTNENINPQCFAEAEAFAKDHPHPLGERPLVDVSTDEMRTAEYVRLQEELLALSQNSKEIIADKSTHFVIIDRPDVVVDAISQVVQSVRNNAKLTAPTSFACPVSQPNEYKNEFLMTTGWPDGTVIFKPGGPGFVEKDGSLSMKFPWTRYVKGQLTIDGRRLDGPAPPLRAHIPSGYGDTGFQATGLIFPTPGCWEVTGHVGNGRLTFVTRVVKVGDGPKWPSH
jgi:pimeloyl-ACP methyl ester carboxylesterase